MALDEANRAVLETILGPIEAGTKFGHEADLDARLTRLVHPELVGLEILLADQARMTRLAATVASDDVRSSHVENLKQIGPAIDRLVQAIRSDSDLGTNLSTEAEALVSRAETGESATASVIEVTASARRRG